MEQHRELSAAGRLILAAIKTHRLNRAAVTRAIGIKPKFMWEILWDYRSLPLDRIDAFATALQMTREERDALVLACNEDKIRRSGRWARASVKPTPVRVEESVAVKVAKPSMPANAFADEYPSRLPLPIGSRY